MEAREPRAALLPEQQGGDVAVPDQGLGRVAEGLRVETTEDAIAAVATARTHDAVDLRILDELHQLGTAAGVVAGEVALAGEEIVAMPGAKARLLEQSGSLANAFRLDRPARSRYAQRGSAPQRVRLAQGRH